MFLQIFTTLLVVNQVAADCSSNMEISNAWNVGATGYFSVPIPTNVNGWTVSVTFSSPVDLTVWTGTNINCNSNTCTFENQVWNGVQNGGTDLEVDFLMFFASQPELVGMTVNGVDVCNGGGSGGGRAANADPNIRGSST